MKPDIISDEVHEITKGYCSFEELNVLPGFGSLSDKYLSNLAKIQSKIQSIFSIKSTVLIDAMSVLWSEFLFSIKQVQFGSDQIEFKQNIYKGLDEFSDLLKVYDSNPLNISKISFQVRTGESSIDDNDDGKSLSEKLKNGNLHPKTLSVKGERLISLLMQGILSQRDEIERLSDNENQYLPNLHKPTKFAIRFAIQYNLQSMYQFLIDEKVFKTRNATLSKLVDLFVEFNLFEYDKSDLTYQKKKFIQRLSRELK
jgi:hypothetical protein